MRDLFLVQLYKQCKSNYCKNRNLTNSKNESCSRLIVWAKNLIYLNASHSLGFGSKWVFNLFLAKMLSADEYSEFSVMNSIANFTSAVISFGSELYILRATKEHEVKTMGSVIICIIGLSTLFVIMTMCLMLNIKFVYTMYSLAFFLGFLYSVHYIFSGYFKSTNKFRVDFANNMMLCILMLMSLAVLYWWKFKTYYEVAWMLILCYLLLMLYISKVSKFTLLHYSKYDFSYQRRRYYGLHAVFSSVYSQASMIIPYYLLTSDTYAAYRMLFLVIMPLSLINLSALQVLVVKYKKITNADSLAKQFRLSIAGLIIMSISTVLILISLEKTIFSFFDFNEGLRLSYYLLLAIPVIQMLNVPYSAMLTSIGKQKIRFFATLASSFLTISGMTLLAEGMDMISVITISVVASLVILTINLSYVEFNFLKSI